MATGYRSEIIASNCRIWEGRLLQGGEEEVIVIKIGYTVLLTSITCPVFAVFKVALGLGWCYAELHHRTVVMRFWGTKLDPVSPHNFAVVGVVANCTMGLFREIIASLINEFGPSFPTQLRSCRCRGELHYGTVWRRHNLFAKRIWTQFPYATSQSSVSWRIALWDCLETFSLL